MVIVACNGPPMIPDSKTNRRLRDRDISGDGVANMGFESGDRRWRTPAHERERRNIKAAPTSASMAQEGSGIATVEKLIVKSSTANAAWAAETSETLF